jgi:hypothetical protein
LVLNVSEAGIFIAFGLALEGKGQVWLGDVHFEEVGTDIPVTGYAHGYPDRPTNWTLLTRTDTGTCVTTWLWCCFMLSFLPIRLFCREFASVMSLFARFF